LWLLVENADYRYKLRLTALQGSKNLTLARGKGVTRLSVIKVLLTRHEQENAAEGGYYLSTKVKIPTVII
jgi:hypothetical protein